VEPKKPPRQGKYEQSHNGSNPSLAGRPTADSTHVTLKSLAFGYATTRTRASRSASAATTTSAPAHAAGCTTRRSLALLRAALGCRPVTLDCGFSPNRPAVADVHISGGGSGLLLKLSVILIGRSLAGAGPLQIQYNGGSDRYGHASPSDTVPEPSTLLLLGAGLIAMSRFVKKSK
jgi:hypothetical protein